MCQASCQPFGNPQVRCSYSTVATALLPTVQMHTTRSTAFTARVRIGCRVDTGADLYVRGRCCHVDKQFAMAVILIIIGVGLTQLGEEVYLGVGVGTVAMASVWIVLIIVRDLKRR